MARFSTLVPIFAILFSLLPAAMVRAQELCVKVARANLRAGPGAEAKKTWEVYENMPFMQLERKGDWLRVRDVDGDEHWVYRTLVDNSSHCVTIKAERANVRKGPGTNFDTWFIVEKYTSFKKVGTEGQWIKVEYEGETMWLFANLVWP